MAMRQICEKYFDSEKYVFCLISFNDFLVDEDDDGKKKEATD